ncbi:hypothetical protein [Thiohalophilus sp.]|uniref:hypothetical protein n=1 Tax=Thiohalophilus sp. TaxID=3028392 RepID=UPI002ACE01E2|nr:hypothetical protein [Thiohalophilus sp.]MDZ7661425.1 hypothetical protein [Thiohalophilus sp.]
MIFIFIQRGIAHFTEMADVTGGNAHAMAEAAQQPGSLAGELRDMMTRYRL